MNPEIVDAGPNKVSRRVVVHAGAAELFAQLADPHQHGQLDGSGTVGQATAGPTRLAQGDTFNVRMKQYGVPYAITSKVVALEPDRVIEWRHPVGHTWRWELAESAPGTTQVTETWDPTGMPGIAYALMSLLGVPRTNAQGIEKTLAGLQARYA